MNAEIVEIYILVYFSVHGIERSYVPGIVGPACKYANYKLQANVASDV